MKKIIVSVALALALPSLVLAFNAATLTNGTNRVAVYNQEQANAKFAEGYVLETSSYNKNVGAVVSNYIPNLINGGGVVSFTATSTQDAKTMPLNWVSQYSQIDIANIVGSSSALTLTTPTAGQLISVLPKIGDSKELYLRNLHTLSATTTTIAAGSGVDLRMGEETGADVIIDGLNNATLTFRRVSATVVSCIVREEVVGD